MASEVGGQQITVIGNVNAAQAYEIDTFFKDLFGTDPTTNGVAPIIKTGDVNGIEEYTNPVTGVKIDMVGSAYAGKNLTLNDNTANVLVNNPHVTKINASKVNNEILIADDAARTVKSKGGNDQIVISGNGNNKVLAGLGNDTIKAGGGNDKLSAGSGNDSIVGGAGDDKISGGTGKDTIEGGAGNDKLSGGTGSDTFVFKNEATGNDIIQDFSKQDILQIADRTGDGKVLSGQDFTVSTSKGDTTVTFLDKDGKPTGDTVVLKGVNKAEADKLFGDTDGDGIFHL